MSATTTYQVLEGLHIQNEPSNDPKGVETVYKKGELFTNHRPDLHERLLNKFAKVHADDRPPILVNAAPSHPKNSSGLKDLTLDQLKALAADEEVDISRLTKHADILRVLQAKMERP